MSKVSSAPAEVGFAITLRGQTLTRLPGLRSDASDSSDTLRVDDYLMHTDPINPEHARRYVAESTARDLEDLVTRRYLELNGNHPMTAEDDAYVDAYFTTVEALARTVSIDAQEIRQLMLAGRLPGPSYLRSDGAQMV